jgi:hypothetical protein
METSLNAAHAASARDAVSVTVAPIHEPRNRLTCAFRPILAIPHLILVGGPMAVAVSWLGNGDRDSAAPGAGGGVLGVVAIVIAVLAWFAIVFGFAFPPGLWNLSAFYMRWRVRAMAYATLLRDEYPPFGDGDYPAAVQLAPPPEPRDRITVAFRLLLAIPHLVLLFFLSIAWAVCTIIAWFAILFSGRHPRALHDFGVAVLRWNTRVEIYLLLLRDEYPPFSLE